MTWARLLVAAVCSFEPAAALAQSESSRRTTADRGIRRPARNRPIGDGTYRSALVIGNAAYKVGALRNPINDAQEMATTLRTLGFNDVRLRRNVTLGELGKSIDEFAEHVHARGGLAFVYYAGHGIEVDQNYLVPVDLNARNTKEVEWGAYRLNMLLARLYRNNGANVIVLDACRNNPFPAFRNIRGGLGKTDAPRGTYIAYAAGPGQVAEDGHGKFGTFTAALVRHIKKPGADIRDVLLETRKDVVHATKERQIPWDSSSLLSRVILNPAAAPKRKGTVAQSAVRVIGPRAAGSAYFGATPINQLPANVQAWPGRYTITWFPNSQRFESVTQPIAVTKKSRQLVRLRAKPRPPSAKKKAPKVEYPEWVIKGGALLAGSTSTFHAVGATSIGTSNLPFIHLNACFRSLSELQKTLEIYRAVLEHDDPSRIKKESVVSESQSAVRTFSAGALNDARCIDYWTHPEDGTVFALASINLDEIGKLKHRTAMGRGVADVLRAQEKDYLASAELNAIGQALVSAASQTAVYSASLLKDYAAAMPNVSKATKSPVEEQLVEMAIKSAFDARMGRPKSALRIKGGMKDYAVSVTTGDRSKTQEFQGVLFEHDIQFGGSGGQTLRFEQSMWAGDGTKVQSTLAALHEALDDAGISVEAIDEGPAVGGAPQIEVVLQWSEAEAVGGPPQTTIRDPRVPKRIQQALERQKRKANLAR